MPEETTQQPPKQEFISKEDLLLLALQEERLKSAQQALELARLQASFKYKLGEQDAVNLQTGEITRK
jgi:hypothetical protein